MLMLCKYPYLPFEGGLTVNQAKFNPQARRASIPRPCGQCLHCRINQTRIWTNRILLESCCHTDKSFVTLTYNEENLPKGGNLDKSHYQNFIKRLRKKISPRKIKYFGVGEYGSISHRPHYHFMLFGIGMEERDLINETWTEPETGEARGFTSSGEINNSTSRYITGYISEKLNPKQPDPDMVPEFMTCSNGIGKAAIQRAAIALKSQPYYKKEVIDRVRRDGKKTYMGRYLKTKFSEIVGNDKELMRDQVLYELDLIDKANLAENYYIGLVDNDEQRMKSIEKRYKIFKQRKEL